MPGRLLRKYMRHWEGLSDCSMPLLRACSWVIAGAGVGLGPTRGSHVAVSAPVCGLRWRDVASTSGGRGLVSAACDPAPLCHVLFYLDSRVAPSLLSECAGDRQVRPRLLENSCKCLSARSDRSWSVTTSHSARRFWTPSVLAHHCCSLYPCPCDLAVISVSSCCFYCCPGLAVSLYLCAFHLAVFFQP